MKPTCIASSSSGNCYVFEFDIEGMPTRIMVECGVPMSDIYKGLNKNLIGIETIKACLITHAHQDHCKAARDMARIGIPVFASKPTLNALQLETEELHHLEPKCVVKGIYAMPFEVEHDIEGAFGFVIKTKTECVIFVNDHKRWTCDLRNFKPDYVFIECNYYHKVVYAQLNELKKKMATTSLSLDEFNESKLKIAQHERNLNSHCSLHGTLKGLDKLNLTKCKAIFLMHLSDRYANEYKMKNEVQLHTGILTYVCMKNGGIK